MKQLFFIAMFFVFGLAIGQETYSVLQTDQFGFPVKTGEIVKVNETTTDFYQYSQLGIPLKTQTVVSDYNDNMYVYQYDNMGQARQTSQIVNNNNFNYQSYDSGTYNNFYRYQQLNINRNVLPIMKLLPIMNYNYN